MDAPSLSPLEIFLIIAAVITFLGLCAFLIRKTFQAGGDIVKAATDDLEKPITNDYVFTCPQGIVKYRIVSKSILKSVLGSQVTIETKLRQILETDPDANLHEYQKTLGITVLSYRKAGKASRSGIYT